MKPMSIRVPRLAKVIMKLVVCIADKAAVAGKSKSNALISIPLTQTIIFVMKEHQTLPLLFGFVVDKGRWERNAS